jgi:ribosomal-protein-alanine N-acetyltransferase
MEGKVMLQDKNIRLVRFNDRHITPEYAGWLNDPEINRFLCVGRVPVDINQIENLNNNNTMFFAILLLDGNGDYIYIGTTSLNNIDWINRKGEIGYIIGDKRFWGKGLATEVVGLISNYALQRLNLHKVEAGVVEGNIGSIKALQKNGFKEYGVIPEDYYLEGKYLDTHRFVKFQNQEKS